MAVRFYAAPP